MNNIDNSIIDFYKDESLSDEQVSSILLAGTRAHRKRRRLSLGLVAAVLLLALLPIFMLQNSGVEEFRSAAIEEVAYNHLKQEQPKIYTTSYEMISESLEKLSFQLKRPSFLNGHTLVGGKYCSVQGVKAAQLKVHDSDGTSGTIYVVPVQEKFAKLQGSYQSTSGVQIDFHHEQGLLWIYAE